MKFSTQFCLILFGVTASLLLVHPSVSSTDRNEQLDLFVENYSINIDGVENSKSNDLDETEASLASVDSRRSYDTGLSYQSYHPGNYAVDFSPLFLALIPIALFLGAAAAFALSVATSSSTAVATAQQQQQQEESSNNNNAANNNNNALLAALVASYSNNNKKTFIIINNSTDLFRFLPYIGRSFADKFRFTLPRRRRTGRRRNPIRPKL